MVRVTPLQQRTDVENAAGHGEVHVLGRNTGPLSDFEPFSMSYMTFDRKKGWYSFILKQYLDEDSTFEPFAWAKPFVPSNLQEFYNQCKECEKECEKEKDRKK